MILPIDIHKHMMSRLYVNLQNISWQTKAFKEFQTHTFLP